MVVVVAVLARRETDEPICRARSCSGRSSAPPPPSPAADTAACICCCRLRGLSAPPSRRSRRAMSSAVASTSATALHGGDNVSVRPRAGSQAAVSSNGTTAYSSSSNGAGAAFRPPDAVRRIHSALAPRVAVLSSPDVDDVLAPNNVDGLADFLRPFQHTVENVTVRTSQLETRQCPSFPLAFEDIEAFAPSPATASSSTDDANLFTPADVVGGAVASAATANDPAAESARQQRRRKRLHSGPAYSRPEVLLDAVSARVRAKSKALWESRRESLDVQGGESTTSTPIGHRRNLSSIYRVDAGLGIGADCPIPDKSSSIKGADPDLERYQTQSIEELTPWFADMRDMVLSARNVSEHETFGHPVAIILAVSSSSPDPMNAFAHLYEASQAHACSVFSQRPYVDPLVFRYYMLIHDVSKQGSALTESLAVLENVKKTYGLHCCLLSVNSAGSSSERSHGISDIWLRALTRWRKEPNVEDPTDAPPPLPTKENHSLAPESSTTSVPPRWKTPAPESGRSAASGAELSSAWHAETPAQGNATEYGALMDDDDVRRLKQFVRDFAAQNLIPFLERSVSLWNEQLAASRKGLTNRLFGASRKFFGSASRGSSNQPATSFATLGYYPHATLEAQTRRLADFAFMTRDYRLAAAMYDYGRRDFSNDKAHKFSASANEMFGLSHLMMMLSAQSALIDVDSYLAAAVQEYLLAPRQNGSALQVDGLRATLLYYEAYRGLDHFRSAPHALVRTANQGTSGTSEDDLEVVGAMLLEQAALADLRQMGKLPLRKCAVHLIMAAHRYRSCGQKHLSLRCFHSAAFCYRLLRRKRLVTEWVTDVEEKHASSSSTTESDDTMRIADYLATYEQVQLNTWRHIDDHMESELAQQAFNDGRIAQAVRHYLVILQQQSKPGTLYSSESPRLHESYMAGFLTCCKFLDTDFETAISAENGVDALKPSLFLVQTDAVSIRVSATSHLTGPTWRMLEEKALGRAMSADKKPQNTTAINELFCVHVPLRNPLHIQMSIHAISVKFCDGESGLSIDDDSIAVKSIEEVVLQPLEERNVEISVSSTRPRKICCIGVSYRLQHAIPFFERLKRQGRRLNDTKQQRASKTSVYAPCEATTVVVHEAEAALSASFVDAPSELGLGEEVAVLLSLKNAGRAPLRKLRAYVAPNDALLDASSILASQNHVLQSSNSLRVTPGLCVPLKDGQLSSDSNFDWRIQLRGVSLGMIQLRVLLVYETVSGLTLTTQLQHLVHVHAVLDMGVQAVPASTKDLRYQLRLGAQSLLEEEASITIERLTFVAPSWQLATSTSFSDTLSNFTNMEPMQRRDAEVQIQEADVDDGRVFNNITHTAKQLHMLLKGRGLDYGAEPSPISLQLSSTASQELELSPFYLLARREYRMALLARDFPSLVDKKADRSTDALDRLEHIFTLYEPGEIDMIVHWRINGTNQHGQAFVFGLLLGPLHDYLGNIFSSSSAPGATAASAAGIATGATAQKEMARSSTRTMYAETERERAALWSEVRNSRLHIEEDPITLEMKPPKEIEMAAGSFDDGRRADVDVEFVVRNLSPLYTRRVILQLDNTTIPPAAGVAGTSNASGRGHTSTSRSSVPSRVVAAPYVGRLTLRATLAPKERAVLHARASIPSAGEAHLGPVLVRSTALVDDTDSSSLAASASAHDFQRLQPCTQTISIRLE